MLENHKQRILSAHSELTQLIKFDDVADLLAAQTKLTMNGCSFTTVGNYAWLAISHCDLHIVEAMFGSVEIYEDTHVVKKEV